MDLPRQELMDHANKFLEKYEGNACVFFKFTCKYCNARCAFEDPNVLYEEGECSECGRISIVDEGGYIAHIGMKKT